MYIFNYISIIHQKVLHLLLYLQQYLCVFYVKINIMLQNSHKELFTRKEFNQTNQVSNDAKKCKDLEQRLLDEQARHQKLTNGN